MNKRFRSGALRKYFIVGFLALVSCAQVRADRTEALGERMICLCGCNQLLSGCTMISCPSSIPMRAELQKYVDKGMTDKEILTTFADKYDKKVLSAPPTTDWFNLSAWVMPFAVLLAGGIAVVYFLRKWKSATPVEPAVPFDTSKYDAEIEEELRKHTPED